MRTHNESDHPTPDILAAFVDGELSEEDRSELVDHLESCAVCRSVVSVASDVLAAPADRRSTRWLGRLVAAAAIALLIAVPVAQVGLPDRTRELERSVPGESVQRFEALAPTDGSVVERPVTFAWREAGPDATYEVTLTDDVGDVVWSTRTSSTEAPLPEDVSLDAGTYFWVVEALLALGREATSGPVRFHVER